jgi:hypothetical protein
MDIITEIDSVIELLEKPDLDKVRFKLGKLRLGVQNLMDDFTSAQIALREAQQALQAANTRRIKTAQALGALQADLGADARERKRKNGSRRGKRKP